MNKKISSLMLGILMILGTITPNTVIAASKRLLKVCFINVHQGDSTLIQTPDKKTLLIDAGKNEEGKNVVSYLKSKGISKIDVLIGTHPDSDHIGGIDTVIDNFKIGKLFLPDTSKDTDTYKDVLKAARKKTLKVTHPKGGKYLKLGHEVKARILAPGSNSYEDANNYSIVLRIVYKKNSFIFTGDAEKTSELEMLRKGYDLKSTVLKVGHHGSKGSTSAQFLIAVKPQYAVISVGHNQYGHPAQLTLDKLAKVGATVYRTDKYGTIIMTSDGSKIKITSDTEKIKDISGKDIEGNVEPMVTKETLKASGKSEDEQSSVVYITRHGKKYHMAGCRYLKGKVTSIKLQDAKAKGLKPCSSCIKK